MSELASSPHRATDSAVMAASVSRRGLSGATSVMAVPSIAGRFNSDNRYKARLTHHPDRMKSRPHGISHHADVRPRSLARPPCSTRTPIRSFLYVTSARDKARRPRFGVRVQDRRHGRCGQRDREGQARRRPLHHRGDSNGLAAPERAPHLRLSSVVVSQRRPDSSTLADASRARPAVASPMLSSSAGPTVPGQSSDVGSTVRWRNP